MRVVLLSGGGGGARFARGLASVLEPGELTVIGNVGDDLEILGLHVSPDLDSLLYTLGGLIDEARGWGRAGESWNALESAESWGGPGWFRLGDRDLGLHLVRTEALRGGRALSLGHVGSLRADRVGDTDRSCNRRLAPHARGRLRPAGSPSRSGSSGVATRTRSTRSTTKAPTTPVPHRVCSKRLPPPTRSSLLRAIPYLSIGLIVAVAEIRAAIETRRVRAVGVSPLVGGAAVTGPLGRMLSRMAGGASPEFVARRYDALIDALVIDEADAPATADVELVVAQTLMRDAESERRLAEAVLETACA